MKNFFKGLSIIIFIITQNTFSQTHSVNPTRPSAADNAYLTTYSYSELEMGTVLFDGGWSLPLMVKATPIQNLEFGLFLNGLVNGTDSETKIGNPGLQLKSQLYDSENFATAFLGRIELIDELNPNLTFYFANSFHHELFQADITIGTLLSDNSNEYDASLIYAIAISPKLNIPIGFYAEIFGDYNSSTNSVFFDFGISYAVSNTLVLDAAFTTNDEFDSTFNQFQIGFTTSLFKLFSN
jgi:hypothetical protein